MDNVKKINWFLDLAERCAKEGSCTRRNYGAIIVDKEGTIVSTGYSGAPKGMRHCEEYGVCWREKNNIPSGSNYNKCRSVHAEMNAIIQAGRLARGSTIYISGIDAKTGDQVISDPCFLCSKMILNAGIEKIIVRIPKNEFLEVNPEEMFKKLEERELGKLELVPAR